MSTVGRVAKNTGFLYLRMGITVFVSLYSTRLILAALGEVDFGIFNVIGGSIVMLGFLNSTLANATQRFMSYAEGERNEENKKKIFNVSLVLHLIIACVTIFLLLALMPLFFDGLLNIPAERTEAAQFVYYTMIGSMVLTIINVPYDAVINAHENMFYYAIIGVIESLIRLGIAFICINSDGDVLIIYSTLIAAIPLFTLSVMKVYCHRHYPECVISIKKYWDFTLVKKMATYSGWNFLTAISSLFSVYGMSIVLNHFFCTALNAAQGIASQIKGQLSSFSLNMMKALNPVIVKRTATQDQDSLSRITFTGCKLSALLILFFAIPVIIKIEYILSIWLEEVPAWTALFCQLELINIVIIQTATPLVTAIYGNGNIKYYTIFKSMTDLLPLILTIIVFQAGMSPFWMYILYIIGMGIIGDAVITYFAKKDCGLSPVTYIKTVVLPIIFTSMVMYILGKSIVLLFPVKNFFMLIMCCISTSLGLLLCLSTFGLTMEEKQSIAGLLRNITKRWH